MCLGEQTSVRRRQANKWQHETVKKRRTANGIKRLTVLLTQLNWVHNDMEVSEWF